MTERKVYANTCTVEIVRGKFPNTFTHFWNAKFSDFRSSVKRKSGKDFFSVSAMFLSVGMVFDIYMFVSATCSSSISNCNGWLIVAVNSWFSEFKM